MKHLNKLQSIIFIIGGVLMAAGAGCYVFMLQNPSLQRVAAMAFLVGTIMFAAMQMEQRYLGDKLTIKRLRRIMSIADVLFMLSGLLMVEQSFGFLERHFYDIEYIKGVYYALFAAQNWVVLLLIAAVLEIYTIHRIGHELEKEADTKN